MVEKRDHFDECWDAQIFQVKNARDGANFSAFSTFFFVDRETRFLPNTARATQKHRHPLQFRALVFSFFCVKNALRALRLMQTD